MYQQQSSLQDCSNTDTKCWFCCQFPAYMNCDWEDCISHIYKLCIPNMAPKCWDIILRPLMPSPNKSGINIRTGSELAYFLKCWTFPLITGKQIVPVSRTQFGKNTTINQSINQSINQIKWSCLQIGRCIFWAKQDTGNIHKAPSASTLAFFLLVTPYRKCSITTTCSPQRQTYPSYGYLMIVWGNRNDGREDKGRDKKKQTRQMKRTEGETE